MPFINELRRNTPLAGGIADLLALDGDTDGILAVAPEMHAIVDPWSRPEFALFRQEFLFHKSIFVAAGGVGFRTIIQLNNNSTDAIITLEPSTMFTLFTLAGSVQLGRTSTLATTDGGAIMVARDSRFPRPNVPYANSRTQNGAAIPAGFTAGLTLDFDVSATRLADSIAIGFPLVIQPGGSVFLCPAVDNNALRVTWIGYVRRGLTPRELRP